MVMSADGKITSATREPPRFGSAADRQHMHRLRADADAVLMGGSTLRQDDPHFTIRCEEALRRRRSTEVAPQPWSIVLSGSAQLPLNRHFFYDPVPQRLVVTTASATPEAVARLQPHCTVWRLGESSVDIPSLLEHLAKAGISRLLVEGGGEVAWQFLAAQVVDELYLTVAPCLLGGRSSPTPVGGDGWRLAERCHLQLRHAQVVGHEIFCRYAVEAPRPPGEALTPPKQ